MPSEPLTNWKSMTGTRHSYQRIEEAEGGYYGRYEWWEKRCASESGAEWGGEGTKDEDESC